MKPKMKPESYPFLRIANQYGMPYSEVLIWADYIRSVGYTTKNMHENFAYTAEVNAAILEFQAIQRGEIDWLTGEPRAEETREFGYDEACAYRPDDFLASQFVCAICGKTECDGHGVDIVAPFPRCIECGNEAHDCRCGPTDDEMDYGDGRERF